MVVLSAAVTTKTGRLLLSRQFVELPRLRIEGLLSAFPKLMATDSQHTFVETDTVRYVYQPLEELYVVLVTTRSSNILEDLETLRLLARVVPEYCDGSEAGVSDNSFDLIFAFDEVISLGYRENVSLANIGTYLAMESAAEAAEIEARKEKERVTRKLMKDKAAAIDKQKAMLDRTGAKSTTGFGSDTRSGAAGFGAGAGSSITGAGGAAAAGSSGSAGMSSMSASGGASGIMASASVGAGTPAATRQGPRKAGMKLGKEKPKATDLLAAMIKEGEVSPGSPSVAAAKAEAAAAGGAGGGGGGAEDGGSQVSLAIVEAVSARLDREGGVEAVEVKGDLTLRIFDPSAAHVRAVLSLGDNRGFQFKTHPNIDKAAFGDRGVLTLKDPSRSFPVNTDLAVLKWRYQTSDEDAAPLVVSCWPSVAGAQSTVTVEYELRDGFELHDVVIAVPCPAAKPDVNSDVGSYAVAGGKLCWSIDMIDSSNGNEVLEFAVPACDAGAFFPIEVRFQAKTLFCKVKVDSVEGVSDGAPVPFRPSGILKVDSYNIL